MLGKKEKQHVVIGKQQKKAEKITCFKIRSTKLIFLYSGLFIAIYVALILFRVFFFPLNFQGTVLLTIALVYTLLVAFSVLSRFPSAFLFDPSKYSKIKYQPSATIVIPAFNEEKIISQTIDHALSSNYPKEKLEVIVVNDGSTDKTAQICQSYADRHLITFINFLENRGKREGLYEAIKLSKTEIVIVIDSDTFVSDNLVNEIVKPLSDPSVGGVCGHTDVKNTKKILAKFQQANYFIGFHLHKKAESLFNNVVCLSGCASAYRKSALIGFIDDWRKQHFLGEQCTFGEDRALTTYLLRRGLKVIYTPAARAITEVPETLKKLFKQRIRWKRSFVRETFLQSKFMFKRSLGGTLLFYSFSITNYLSPFVSTLYLIILPIIALVTGSTDYITTIVYLLGILLISSLYGLYTKLYTKFPISWMIGWSFFNTFVISFSSIYAYFTVKSKGWMTR